MYFCPWPWVLYYLVVNWRTQNYFPAICFSSTFTKILFFFPKTLKFLHKQHRVDIAEEMLGQVINNPTFIKRMITAEETWFYEFGMLTGKWMACCKWTKTKKICQTIKKPRFCSLITNFFQKVQQLIKSICEYMLCRLREAFCQKDPIYEETINEFSTIFS